MPAIFAFYRNFIWFSLFISLSGCLLITVHGSWAFMVVVFWGKIATNVFLGLYIHVFHSDQYHFFHHLGFDKPRLYLFTFLLDMAIWVVLSLLTIFIFL
jgi:hypothetical protein